MQFIVSISDPATTDYTMTAADGSRSMRLYVPQSQPEIKEGADFFRYTPNEFTKYTNIMFTNTLDDAKFLALELSKVNPGKTVYYAPLQGAFQCVPGNPVEKSISNKGTLPV